MVEPTYICQGILKVLVQGNELSEMLYFDLQLALQFLVEHKYITKVFDEIAKRDFFLVNKKGKRYIQEHVDLLPETGFYADAIVELLETKHLATLLTCENEDIQKAAKRKVLEAEGKIAVSKKSWCIIIEEK